MTRVALLSILLAGCAGMPSPSALREPSPTAVELRRECPPLPTLRARASGRERRVHTQTIVRMYVACAGGAHDRRQD